MGASKPLAYCQDLQVPPVGQSPQVVMRRVRLRVGLKTESARGTHP